MKKVRTKVKMIAVTAAAVIALTATGHVYMTRAGEQRSEEEISRIQLNVEKEDRDTIKIYLSNFTELAKSMQLSVKIEGENVKFNDENIEWLVDKKLDNSSEDNNTDSDEKYDNVILDYKLDSDKKGIDFFMLSDKPLNSDGGIIEICKIDVSKNESLADKLLKSDDASYRVVPNSDGGDSYSYVTYSTNKNIRGNDIENADDTILNMNTKPVISFKDVPSVVGDKIVIVKGTVFRISDYVKAEDADGNVIEDIKYSGNVDNKKIGSYNIKCTVTDSNNESAELDTTVIVEESSGDFAAPYIYVPDEPLKVTVGGSIDLLSDVYAKDYQSRELEVKVDENYDINNTGVYTVTYSATDFRGITVTKTRTLLVVSKNDTDFEDDDTEVVVPGKIPSELEGIIDNVQLIAGDGTSAEPLLVDVSSLSEDDFMMFLNKLDKFEVNTNNIRVEYDNEFKTAHLELKKKHSMFSLASLLRNSGSIYLSVRVEQSKSELVNVMNNFLAQIGYVEEDNSEKPENPGGTEGDSDFSGDIDSPGESGGSDNNGGTTGSGGLSGSSSGNSNSSGSSSGSSNEIVNEDKKIPFQLEDIMNKVENIEHVKGNGTITDPLLVNVNNMSSTGFRSFLTELDKFKIISSNIRMENFIDYRIVHLELNEKSSLFNIARLFRSSESTYMSIRIDNTNTELVRIMDDFLAKLDYNQSNDSGNAGSDESTDGSHNSGSAYNESGSENWSSAGNSGSSSVTSYTTNNINNNSNLDNTNVSKDNASGNIQSGSGNDTDDSINNTLESADSELGDNENNQNEIENKSDNMDSDNMNNEKDNSADYGKGEGKLQKQAVSPIKIIIYAGVFAAAAAGVIISVLHFKKSET